MSIWSLWIAAVRRDAALKPPGCQLRPIIEDGARADTARVRGVYSAFWSAGVGEICVCPKPCVFTSPLRHADTCSVPRNA